MSWTALVAEYLVIGLQCLAWLGLLFLWGIGVRTPDAIAGLRALDGGLWAPVTIVLLATSYTLGMLFDKLYHLITERLLRNRVKKLWPRLNAASRDPSSVGTQFYRAEDSLYTASGQEARLFRRRGRIRVVRAALFNLPLIGFGLITHMAGSIRLQSLTALAFALLWSVGFADFRALHSEYLRMIARVAPRTAHVA